MALKVEHPKWGRGVVVQCYEFYNHIYADVKFDLHPETQYINWDYLKEIKDEENTTKMG
jgi:hypothetical protein